MLKQQENDFEQSTFQEEPKKNRKKLVIWIVVILLVLMCVCGVVGFRFFRNVFEVMPEQLAMMEKDREEITAVLDNYFSAIKEGDLEGAYQLYSPRVLQQERFSDFEQLVSAPEYACFDNYLGVIVMDVYTYTQVIYPPHEGEDATATGMLLFEENLSYMYSAGFMLVEDEWMVDWFIFQSTNDLECAP